jgi:hypothetical protein
MLRFYAGDFVRSIETMQGLSHLLRGARDQRYYDDEGYELVRSAMSILASRLTDLNMAVSLAVTKRVLDACEKKFAPRVLNH